MPETAELELVCPPGFESVEAFREQLVAHLTTLEDDTARALAAEGRSFLGAARVRAQSPGARPAPGEPRRGLNPRIAGQDRWKRMEAIQRLKEFLRDYRCAWREFASGVRNVIFPFGTYGMRLLYGVQCARTG